MVTLVFTLCCLALSQQQDVELSPQERASAVHEAARLLESEYVFPDEGKKMATAITGHLDKGDYDKVAGAKVFAERLTSDMQTVFGDRHLSVDFWEHRIEMPSGGPSEQWKESRAKLLRHHNAAVVRAERLDGNVGYIKIDGFYGADVAARPINAAMAFVAETDALVIDLRDNGGGVNESVQLLASYFFSEPTEISRYYDRPTDTTRQFWTMPSLPGARYLDKPVTLLVGPETASAAEAFA